jgi:hypothetical protein
VRVDAWLAAVVADAERRGLPELGPLLESLARATTALREADFNADASGSIPNLRRPGTGGAQQ